jgi:dienelactone hydrolase
MNNWKCLLSLLALLGLLTACSQGRTSDDPNAMVQIAPTDASPPPPTDTSETLPTLTSQSASTPTLQAVQTADLQVQTQQVVEWLVAENFASVASLFDATMTDALPQDQLEEIWETLIAQVGPFQSRLGVRAERQGLYDVVYVTVQFEQTNLDVKVVWNVDGKVSGLFVEPAQRSQGYMPPEYVAPGTFHDQEVLIGQGEWVLPASLSLPVGQGAFPGVVLVHGSGPNDRDETIGPNKPFRDLAGGLASHGIAVLRYEKRTREYAVKLAEFPGGLTVEEETIEDALAAVSLLKEAEGIDTERVFVLGHSLGGMLLPRIAARDAEIAGLIILAGATRPLDDITLEQVRYIAELDGNVTEQESAEVARVEADVQRIKNLEASADFSTTETILGAPPSYWLDLRHYDPAVVASTLSQPMLILQGERDYQVTMQDFAGWEKALSTRDNVVFKSYPGLNHLFIAGEGPSGPGEYQIAGHVAQAVIDDVVDWIRSH